MHDPQFGLGMDTRVMMWHPCKVEVHETNHNDVDWVDLRFMRHIDVAGGAWSTEQVEVQVRREVAKDLLRRLFELFTEHLPSNVPQMLDLYIGEEEPCPDATVEE